MQKGGSLAVSAFATFDKATVETLAVVVEPANSFKLPILAGAAAALSVQDVNVGNETKSKALVFSPLAIIPFVKNLFSPLTPNRGNSKAVRVPLQPEKPKAYLEISIFADSLQTNLLTTKQLAISEQAEIFWEKLQDSLVIEQDGFAVVSLKNTSDLPVLFDNLELKVYGTEKAIIIQENHYEPYGMTLKGLDYVINPAQKNQFLYNDGTEREESMGLEWDETPFRPYDKNLGRFTGVDKLADFYMSVSPYIYSLNNPISFNDPSGLKPEGETWEGLWQRIQNYP